MLKTNGRNASGYHDPPSEYTLCLPELLTSDFRKVYATNIFLCRDR
jgi:hypothetical protein